MKLPRILLLALGLVAWEMGPSSVQCAGAPPQKTEFTNKLPPGAIARLGTLRVRCLSDINCVAFSPDGQYVACGESDGVTLGGGITLWNRATGELVRRFGEQHGGYNQLVFTPDGKTLVSLGSNGLSFWDVDKGTILPRIASDTDVHALAVSGDGKIFAGSSGNEIFLWSEDGGKLIRDIKTPSDADVVSFTPDGKWLVSIDSTIFPEEKTTVRFWDVGTGKQVWQLPTHQFWQPTSNRVAFSSDGVLFAMGAEQGRIEIWNTKSRKQVRVLAGDKANKWARVLGFVENDSLLITQGHSKDVRIWDVPNGKLKEKVPAEFALAIALSPDGKTLAYGHGITLKLWDIKAGKHAFRQVGHDWTINSISFSPDGKLLASCAFDRTIRLWDSQAHKELRHWEPKSKDSAWNVDFSADGKVLLSVSRRTIELWDPSTGRLTAKLRAPNSEPVQARILPDQKTAVSIGYNNVHLWSIEQERLLHEIPASKNRVWKGAISADGRLTAIYYYDKGDGLIDDGYIDISDTEARKKKGPRITATRSLQAMEFSPDGKYLAWADSSESIHVWDLQARKRHRLFTTRDQVHALAFDRTGRYLASGGSAARIQIWDMKSAKAAGEFTAPRGGIKCLAFSPTKDILASTGEDCTITLWDLHKKEVTPIPRTDKLLEELLAAYRKYDLPIPPAGAKLVRLDVYDGKLGLSFVVKPQKSEKPVFFWPPPTWLDVEKTTPVKPEPASLRNISSWRTDLLLAIQCKALGYHKLAKALFESSSQIVAEVAHAELAVTAWDYWRMKLANVKTDRADIARRLKSIMAARPNAFNKYQNAFLQSLELTLKPSKAKPGSIEALIDDLVNLEEAPLGKYGLKMDPRYLKLALRGFEAVPGLIEHLEDERLTKIYFEPGINNFRSYHYRIAHAAAALLQGLSGKKFGAWELRGDLLTKTTARRWWQKARKIGEEAYLVRHVLGEEHEEWPNDVMLKIIADKYPKQLPKIYRRLLDDRPYMVGSYIARTVAESSLPKEEKRKVFVYGAQNRKLSLRLDALARLRKLDPKQFDALLVKSLKSFPRKASVEDSIWEEVEFTYLVGQTTNPKVWDALEHFAKRCKPAVRIGILANLIRKHERKDKLYGFHTKPDSSQIKARVNFMARFLKDATAREPNILHDSSDADPYQFPRLEVRNYAAVCIANFLDLKINPKSDWSPAQWAKLRREVKERLTKLKE